MTAIFNVSPKKIFNKIIISLFLLFCFTNITNLPIPFKYNIESILLIFLFVCGGYFLWTNFFKSKILCDCKLLVSYVVISFLLVFLSAVLAKCNFNQPLMYGILSLRKTVYSFAGIIIYIFLKKKHISIINIENVFASLFFLSLLFYMLVNIILPPEKFLTLVDPVMVKSLTIGYDEARGISRYRFDVSLIVFGFIYFALSFYKYKIFSLAYVLASFVYIFYFSRGRIVIFTISVIIFFVVLFVANLKTKLNLVVSCIVCISIFFLYDSFFGVNLSALFKFFVDGINAFLGNSGSDSSANARIFESTIAWHYIEKYNYLGVGSLSQKWILTPESVFGYFFPSDVGLLGLVFIYGPVSIVAFCYIFIKTFSYYYKINKDNSFVVACWLYSIYILFTSLMTGFVFISAFGQFSIMAAVLSFYIYSNEIQNSSKNHSF